MSGTEVLDMAPTYHPEAQRALIAACIGDPDNFDSFRTRSSGRTSTTRTLAGFGMACVSFATPAFP